MQCLVDELCLLCAKEKVTSMKGIIKRSSERRWKIENLNEQFKRSHFLFNFYSFRPKPEVELTRNQEAPDRSSSFLKKPSPHPSHRDVVSGVCQHLHMPSSFFLGSSSQKEKFVFSHFCSTLSGHRQGVYEL